MIIDYSDKVYYKLGQRKGKVFSLIRFVYRVFFSFFIETYLRIFPSKITELPPPPSHRADALIVSITSFPLRIGKIWIVIECILRQKMLPNKIVLTLAKSQFENDFDDLPKSLAKYIDNKLLTIDFVDDDIRSHKKYFYTFQNYNDHLVVLLDDDIIYPSTILNDLYSLHKIYPDQIIAHRCYNVSHKKHGQISPYNSWKYSRLANEPLATLFHTSGAGTLYRPSWFDSELYNAEIIKKLCMYADDVWLNVHAQRNSIKTIKTTYNSLMLPIMRRQDVKLKTVNKEENGNDIQLKNLAEYYNLRENQLFN